MDEALAFTTYIAKRMYRDIRKYYEWDDFLQYCYEVVVKYMGRYDKSLGSVNAYVNIVVRSCHEQLLRHAKTYKRKSIFDTVELTEDIEDTAVNFENSIMEDLFNNYIINMFSGKNKELLYNMGAGLMGHDLCEAMGVSRQCINQRLHKIRSVLKRRVNYELR